MLHLREPTMSTISSIGRFQPASRSDFSERARNLAWVLDAQLGPTRTTLARLFGFSSVHELEQSFLRTPLECGPYSDDPSLLLTTEGCRFLERRLDATEAAVVHLVRDGRPSPDSGQLAALGLFHSPVEHRRMARTARAAAMLQVPIVSRPFPPSIDAALVFEEGIASLTFAGQALVITLDDITRMQVPAVERVRRLIRMAEEGDVPWSLGAYVAVVAREVGVGSWPIPDDAMLAVHAEPAAEEMFIEAPLHAAPLLPVIDRAVDGYRHVIERCRSHGDDPLGTPVESVESGLLAFYPELLYWGGLVRLAARDFPGAIELLGEAVRIGLDVDSGAREYLAIAELNAGRMRTPRWPGGRFSYRTSPVAPDLLRAFASYARAAATTDGDGRASAAGVGDRYLVSALSLSPHLIRAFDPAFRSNDDVPPANPGQSLAACQELLHRTEPFQARHPEAFARLHRILGDPALRAAYVDFHHQQSRRGGRQALDEAFRRACSE